MREWGGYSLFIESSLVPFVTVVVVVVVLVVLLWISDVTSSSGIFMFHS
mgnify:CR=1 FL=1